MYDFQELEVPADVEGNDVLAAAGITGTGALATAPNPKMVVRLKKSGDLK